MGYSMRIDHTDGCSYRFTVWPRWNGSALAPIWSEIKAVELYLLRGILMYSTSNNSHLWS